MSCSSMRNGSQRTGLGSFLWTSRGVAGGTYLARFQMWPAIERSFFCFLPKCFPTLAPPSWLLPEQQLMVAWSPVLLEALASSVLDLEPDDISGEVQSVFSFHVSQVYIKNLYFHMAFFLKSWVRLNRETTVDYIMKTYLWHGCLPQLDSVQKKKKRKTNKLFQNELTVAKAFKHLWDLQLTRSVLVLFRFQLTANQSHEFNLISTPELHYIRDKSTNFTQMKSFYRTSLHFKTLWRSKRKLL